VSPAPAAGSGRRVPALPPVVVDGLTGRVPALLVDGLVRRLPADGLDAVVLAAAGTRNSAARATVEWAAGALSARLGVPCAVAYASAAPPLPGAAMDLLRAAGARRIGVAAYFLAPGRLYDLAADSARAAGAVAVAEPLTDAPELVRLVAARVDEVAARTPAAA
jgi:sirohydrochlorin ferrochelatase